MQPLDTDTPGGTLPKSSITMSNVSNWEVHAGHPLLNASIALVPSVSSNTSPDSSTFFNYGLFSFVT